MFEENNIYNVDCLRGLELLPENSIDCIITDPPYGDDCGYGRNNKCIVNNETPLLNCNVLYKCQRVLKNNKTIYNFTNWKHYPFLTEFVMRYTCFNIRMMVVLNKNKFGLGSGFRNQHELLLVLEKGEPEYNDKGFSNVMDFKTITFSKDTHPHEKPQSIMRKLLQHSTKENDLVLDCFLGTGSTVLACKQLQRRFIGFEIDTGWFNIAKDRLEQSTLHTLNSYGGETNDIEKPDFEHFERQRQDAP